ncbi:hypothetical protein DFH08DRAFT_716434, partial [Mycena albidolilacea]
PYSVWPFSEAELAKVTVITKKHMKDFNYKLSKQCISVEHAFGCLKLCFHSLQLMGSHNNGDNIWCAIDTMLIFHNLCLCLDNDPRYLLGYTEIAGTMEEDLNTAVDNAVGVPINIPLGRDRCPSPRRWICALRSNP